MKLTKYKVWVDVKVEEITDDGEGREEYANVPTGPTLEPIEFVVTGDRQTAVEAADALANLLNNTDAAIALAAIKPTPEGGNP